MEIFILCLVMYSAVVTTFAAVFGYLACSVLVRLVEPPKPEPKPSIVRRRVEPE